MPLPDTARAVTAILVAANAAAEAHGDTQRNATAGEVLGHLQRTINPTAAKRLATQFDAFAARNRFRPVDVVAACCMMLAGRAAANGDEGLSVAMAFSYLLGEFLEDIVKHTERIRKDRDGEPA